MSQPAPVSGTPGRRPRPGGGVGTAAPGAGAPGAGSLEQRHYFVLLPAGADRARRRADPPDRDGTRCLQGGPAGSYGGRAAVCRRLTLDDLARETGFSKFYLERSFNDRYGLPIHQFLKRVRIARALALLRQGERPAAVAKAVVSPTSRT